MGSRGRGSGDSGRSGPVKLRCYTSSIRRVRGSTTFGLFTYGGVGLNGLLFFTIYVYFMVSYYLTSCQTFIGQYIGTFKGVLFGGCVLVYTIFQGGYARIDFKVGRYAIFTPYGIGLCFAGQL